MKPLPCRTCGKRPAQNNGAVFVTAACRCACHIIFWRLDEWNHRQRTADPRTYVPGGV